ncbi:MAG: hypothetical protein ACYTGL_29305 [Planctomycetota bacterium]|jgi:hypothetical protein
MSSPAQEFWGVLKFFGPLAVLQVVAFTVSAFVAPGNYGVLFSANLTVVLIAAGAGYSRGKRDALSDAQVSTSTETADRAT